MPNRTILGIDTSQSECSAALVCDGKTVAHISERQDRGRAERLFPMLFELLSIAGREWRDLDAIAVVSGPGNSTGIRLAISAGRGLSMSLNIPAIGITAFESAAYGTGSSPIHVVIKAPQGRAHAQTIPDGKTEFDSLENLSKPAPGLIVIGDEFIRETALLWGCRWQKPKWSMAEAAATKVSTFSDLSNAESPVPFYHTAPVAQSSKS